MRIMQHGYSGALSQPSHGVTMPLGFHKEPEIILIYEVANAERLVKVGAYQRPIGEIVNMHANPEIIVDPNLQRLFR